MTDIYATADAFEAASPAQRRVLERALGKEASPFSVIPEGRLTKHNMGAARTDIARFMDNAPGVIDELSRTGSAQLANRIGELQVELNTARTTVGAENFDTHVARGRQENTIHSAREAVSRMEPNARITTEQRALQESLAQLASDPSNRSLADTVATNARTLAERGGADVSRHVTVALSPVAEAVGHDGLRQMANSAPQVRIDASRMPAHANPDYRGAVHMGQAGAIRDTLINASTDVFRDSPHGEAYRQAVSETVKAHTGPEHSVSARSMQAIQQETAERTVALARASDPNLDERFLRERIKSSFDAAGDRYATSLRAALTGAGENGQALAPHIKAGRDMAGVADDLTRATQAAELTSGRAGLDAVRATQQVAAGEVTAAGIVSRAAGEAPVHSVGKAVARLGSRVVAGIPIVGGLAALAGGAANAAEATAAYNRGEITGPQLTTVLGGETASVAGGFGGLITSESTAEAAAAIQREAGVPRHLQTGTMRQAVQDVGVAVGHASDQANLHMKERRAREYTGAEVVQGLSNKSSEMHATFSKQFGSEYDRRIATLRAENDGELPRLPDNMRNRDSYVANRIDGMISQSKTAPDGFTGVARPEPTASGMIAAKAQAQQAVAGMDTQVTRAANTDDTPPQTHNAPQSKPPQQSVAAARA